MNKTHILAAMVLVALVVVTGLAPSDGLAQQTPAAPKTGTPAPPAVLAR